MGDGQQRSFPPSLDLYDVMHAILHVAEIEEGNPSDLLDTVARYAHAAIEEAESGDA